MLVLVRGSCRLFSVNMVVVVCLCVSLLWNKSLFHSWLASAVKQLTIWINFWFSLHLLQSNCQLYMWYSLHKPILSLLLRNPCIKSVFHESGAPPLLSPYVPLDNRSSHPPEHTDMKVLGIKVLHNIELADSIGCIKKQTNKNRKYPNKILLCLLNSHVAHARGRLLFHEEKKW